MTPDTPTPGGEPSDDEIVAVWQSMPGGADGWLKHFGFIQFARAILSRFGTRPAAEPVPNATTWVDGTPKPARLDGETWGEYIARISPAAEPTQAGTGGALFIAAEVWAMAQGPGPMEEAIKRIAEKLEFEMEGVREEALSASSPAAHGETLKRFLDAAGGEGLVLDGVDAGDLYMQLYGDAHRALEAWDSTVLPKSNDGMMQERMEDLRASLAAPTPAQGESAAPAEPAGLREAASAVLAMCDSIGDFRNGVTDPTGTIDEGAIRAGELLEDLRRALATPSPAPQAQQGVSATEWARRCGAGVATSDETGKVLVVQFDADAWGRFASMFDAPQAQQAPAAVHVSEAPARDPHRGGNSYEASMLRNLLARIHRDGGHYVEQHGLDKALEDADAQVVKWLGAEAPAQTEAVRAKLNQAMDAIDDQYDTDYMPPRGHRGRS